MLLALLLLFADPLAEKSAQARALLEARRYAEAAALYEEVAKALPANGGLWMNAGLARFQAAEFEQAAPALEKAVKLNPRLAPAHLLLGMARLKLGEPARAVAPLEASVRLDPANETARTELASAYLEAERFDEAAAAYAKLPGAKAALGRGYALLGIAARATAELERRAGPDSPWLAKLRAPEAARDWPQLLANRRPLPEPLYWRAMAAHALAAESLTKLAGAPEAVEFEAEVLRAEGKYKEAAAKWEQALLRAPQDARLRKRLAQSHWQSGDLDAASRALEGLPEDGEVLFLRGDFARRQDDLAAARALWERAAKRSPGNQLLRAALGKLLLESGEPAAAIPHLEAARELEPAVLFQLSRAYAAAGRPSEAARARAEFQRRQRTAP